MYTGHISKGSYTNPSLIDCVCKYMTCILFLMEIITTLKCISITMFSSLLTPKETLTDNYLLLERHFILRPRAYFYSK